jgi:hypothetical protein
MNAPTKAPKASVKSKGVMIEGGMSTKIKDKKGMKGMMSKKERIRYLK